MFCGSRGTPGFKSWLCQTLKTVYFEALDVTATCRSEMYIVLVKRFSIYCPDRLALTGAVIEIIID